jgi:NAD(P)-dependent dehydrogenase (short-subunit alcohol dehydrogenase family)
MNTFEGRVAAVTGAGSGIGRAVATELARRGSEVALCDIDEAGMAETAARIQATGTRASTQPVDVADRQAVEDWADKVVADHGKVNVIVNNAGVALGANVETMSYEDMEWLIGVNFWGVVHGTKAFLPHLRAAGEGHIVNISSVFGMMGIPSQSAYNAAKFAVRGFTEALRIELDSDGGNVSCTTIHPGGIKTNIARNGRFDHHTMSALGQDPDKLIEMSERVFMTAPD